MTTCTDQMMLYKLFVLKVQASIDNIILALNVIKNMRINK